MTRLPERRAAEVLGALLAAASFAQDQPPPEPRPAFPAGVEWVEVDVVVVDHDGEPVRGLRAADFSLEEDGVPQVIAAFEAIDAGPAAAALAPAEPFVGLAAPAGPPAPLARLFVVVFDDLHIAHADVPRAREAVRRFLEGLGGGDHVLLVAPGRGTWWHARLPEGRDALLAQLERLASRARAAEDSREWMTDDEATRIANDDPLVLRRVVRRWEASATDTLAFREPERLVERVKDAARYVRFDAERRTAETLDVLARGLASLGDARGRKSVVLVSGGFIHDPREKRFRAVVTEARRANAAIHFVDARGLAAVGPDLTAEASSPTDLQDTPIALASLDAASEGSESLAADTGGHSVRKRNDLGPALVAVARESSSCYLLGYPSPPGRDRTRFRRIEVKVDRVGVRVRARPGYYPAPADVPGTVPKSRRDLERALDSPLDARDVPLRTAAFVLGEAGRGKLRVLLTTEVDVRALALREEGGVSVDTLDFVLAIAGEAGGPRRTDEKIPLRLGPDEKARSLRTGLAVTREAALEPGLYQARVVVRDGNCGRLGSLRQELVVPATGALRLSTLFLSDRLRGGGAFGPEVTARRAFAASGTLHARFEVYGAARGAGGRPSVRAAFVAQHAEGRVLALSEATPIVAAGDGSLGRTFGIPLEGAPTGRYELVVVAQDETSGGRAEARETFFVEEAGEGGSPAAPPPR